MDHQTMLALGDEWEQLLQEFEIERTPARHVFDALTRAYASAGRVYHTLDHIQDMLGWLERLRGHARELPVIQLAAWFHDCVYDPRASDNEEQSALYAQRSLADLSFPDPTIQTISRLILSTKTHQVTEADTDNALLLDADLAILGAPAPAYDVYAQAIREEYHRVPETTYKTARGQILRAFLQRPRLYLTQPMYMLLEEQARENLDREIRVLA